MKNEFLDSALSQRHGPVISISEPLGDLHDEGSSVRRYEVSDGSSLIVKPRKMERDILIHDIVNEYCGFLGSEVLGAPNGYILCGHTVQEEVQGTQQISPTPESLFNAGHAAYLCALLNIADQHSENVIWQGVVPSLCDVEAGELQLALKKETSGQEKLRSTGWLDASLIDDMRSPTGLEKVPGCKSNLLVSLAAGLFSARNAITEFVERPNISEQLITFLAEPYRIILTHTATYEALIKLWNAGETGAFISHYEYMNLNRSMGFFDIVTEQDLGRIRDYELFNLKSGYIPRFEYHGAKRQIRFGHEVANLMKLT